MSTELEKMAAVQKESQSIGEFLDWLQGHEKITLCTTHVHEESCYDADDNERICGGFEDVYTPFHWNIEQLLADYFEIDLDKVDNEKRAILEELRQKHG